MKKVIRLFCFLLILFLSALMSAVVYGFYTLPDQMYTLSGSEVDVGFYSCTVADKRQNEIRAVGAVGEYKVNISLFNKIPVKISKLTVSDRKYVVASGDIIGLRMFTKGVMVVALDSVDTDKGKVSPARQAGIRKGDVITHIDGVAVESSAQVDAIITASAGKSMRIKSVRDGVTVETELSAVYSVSEGRYKTGLWIRDSAAGIGTMTFYEKNTGFFACLGHAVCDVDTGEILPLSNGDIVEASISGCVKGRSGSAGELCGSFRNHSLGTLFLNDDYGVFGYLNSMDAQAQEIPIALKSEVKIGSAQIIATVENEGKDYYSIEIEKLSSDDKDGKNMVIKITDSRLIEKTGGIVQGMSGSPIIQDGRLVGAVTHVFLNDPTRGYAILAETMLEKAREVELDAAG